MKDGQSKNVKKYTATEYYHFKPIAEAVLLKNDRLTEQLFNKLSETDKRRCFQFVEDYIDADIERIQREIEQENICIFNKQKRTMLSQYENHIAPPSQESQTLDISIIEDYPSQQKGPGF